MGAGASKKMANEPAMGWRFGYQPDAISYSCAAQSFFVGRFFIFFRKRHIAPNVAGETAPAQEQSAA
jgi:hypothetical protein